MRKARFKQARRNRSRFRGAERDAASDEILPRREGRIARRYEVGASMGSGGHGMRRRIDRYHYGRRPLEFTRSTAISLVAAFILLILCGIAAYRESASIQVTDGYHAAARS